MIKVGSKSKLTFHWKVNPYDYSDEKMKEIIAKASKKYGVTKDSIKVVPDFIMLNDKGENINISNDLILNIQNPLFQLELFNEYLKINKIEDYDFEYIKNIDSEVNSQIDYEKYDKYRKYSVKWIKWSNFLSYGKDNYFDFSSLKGLVLLNGEPANQSGKTTFAIDLLHFLLFGKTDKASTQDKIFNKWLKEETEVVVEGCINIEGEDYVIKRTLSRPQYKKRTSKSKTTQKVEYYRLVGENLEELEEYIDNQQEENSIKTNKVIKETIGNENDFDLIICATSGNLDDLIEKKDTERGRLLSRWIGLLPIERKEELAKEKFNTAVKPYLLSNKYDTETLLQQREAFFLQMKDSYEEIEKTKKRNNQVEEEINKLEETKNMLLSARQTIDVTIAKIDITTLNANISRLTESGLNKKTEIETLDEQIKSINVENYSENEYDKLTQENIDLNTKLSSARIEFKHISNQIIDLEKGEYCPTCGKKLDNVDNSNKINELKEKLTNLKNTGEDITNKIKEVVNKINSLKEARDNFNLKSKLIIKKSACEVQIEQLRNELKDNKYQKKEFEKNAEAIKKNNEIDLNIRNTEIILKGHRNTKEENILYINNLENKIEGYKMNVKNIEDTIEKIKEEEKVIKNWKIYLDMVGKNGISKMVLRKALPIINAQIAHLLNDVCDFDIQITISDKNEIMFHIIKNGVISDISSGSGFEKTASALALRFVLAKNSVLPKMNVVVLDEIYGRVAKENLENIKTILDRVKDEYGYILSVTHNDDIKEWFNTIITVSKDENGISYLKTSKN